MGETDSAVQQATTPESSTDTSRRLYIEERLGDLLVVTSADEAYDIIDSAFTPPSNTRNGALATWHYHAERTRRQMVSSALGEITARTTVSRVSDHFDTHGSVAIADAAEHPVRSPSLQDFVKTMQHWFSNILAETARTDDTAKALVEAGNRRRPLFRQAVANWVEFRQQRDPNFTWELPPTDVDMADDVVNAYSLNMANEVPNQFLIFGLDAFRSGMSPAELAHFRVHHFPTFTSTVHEVSAPVMGPFVSYDPETGVNEHQKDKETIQVLYSEWDRNPTPDNAHAFLSLARDPKVLENLTQLSLMPGSGPDGRAINPGHCHIDMRIVREDAFPVSPRDLLRRLGEPGLAQNDYLNMATLVAGIGMNAATHTLYSHWPQR
jgi:hypothetical protein